MENEKVVVWFGRSYVEPETIVVFEEGEPVEYLDLEEGDTVVSIPVYRPEVESWLFRADMSFSRFSISREQIPQAEKLYTLFIQSSREEPHNETKTEKARQDFLAFVGSLNN